MANDFSIKIRDLGKKFNREWIFRGLNLELHQGQAYAVTGPNGSGKSTLLKIISGIAPPSSGEIEYFGNGKKINASDIYKHIVACTPYLEIIEELTLREFLDFHFQFKKISYNIAIDDLIEIMYLRNSKDKKIMDFSSGMRQRLKLGIAFYSNSEIVLLDEPTMNLDQKAIDWYHEQIKNTSKDKLLLICSNQSDEYRFSNQVIDINQFKKK
ncbi:ABC transporter ATP-binding protein [Fulvitalea axinellae]|uniref:ABC transporter ATP-binding protein n=1 Tax=Fulvitalea axinellae TaxID=1182444 RepID=A0AAU9D3I7_9BACT|nr:ABC transporter ATP-binding protein [Fulvitalea axinellae]